MNERTSQDFAREDRRDEEDARARVRDEEKFDKEMRHRERKEGREMKKGTGIVEVGIGDFRTEIRVRRSGCTDPDTEFVVSEEKEGPFAGWGCPAKALDFGGGPEDEQAAHMFGRPVVIRATVGL